MVNCVSILGSTGSIGRQSLDIVKHLGIGVAALTAGKSVERMAEQCREFRPKLAVMATEEAAAALAEQISDLPVDVEWGEGGLLHAASMEEADCVITAVVGMLGLKPTLEAIRRKKRIGLANKVVPQAELLDACRAMAKTIMSKGSYAVSVAKAVINAGLDMDLANGLKMEADAFGLTFATHDKQEGMTAFLEKRPAELTDF